jgi:leucyl aminopeptidase
VAQVHVEATTQGPLDTGADTIVVGVFEQEGVAHDVPGDALAELLNSGEARTELGRVAVTHAAGRRFILVGLGPRPRFGPERARVAAAKADTRARELGAQTLCWELPHHVYDAVAGALVHGTVLHAYRFDRYKPSEDTGSLKGPSSWRAGWRACPFRSWARARFAPQAWARSRRSPRGLRRRPD